MLHTNNQIIKRKVSLLNLAEELQNVSTACKIMGFLGKHPLNPIAIFLIRFRFPVVW